MSSDIGDGSARDGNSLTKEPDLLLAQNDHRQLEFLSLDDSEPEVVSESDEDEDIFFKPSPSLPSPIVIKRTLRELNDLINTPYLDLDSAGYRPRLYEGTDALIGIIDSLSQSYEFPPIFFNQKQVRGSDGSIQYNRRCIDGLKRLSAIKAFVDGEIPCHDYRRRKWYFCLRSKEDRRPVGTGKRRALPDDDKEQFLNKHFVCHEFEDLTGVEEIELRARVHLGSTLSPGERLRATMAFSRDLMINFTKRLQQDFQEIADLSDTKRLRGFQNLMKCSAQIFEVQMAEAEKRPPVLRISDTALTSFTLYADAVLLQKIEHALMIFKILLTRYPKVFDPILDAPFSSMEMVVIAVLTFKYCESRIKPSLFIHLIGSLRQSIHKISHHQGVLQTRQNWAHAWKCIQDFKRSTFEDESSDLYSALQHEMGNLVTNEQELGIIPSQGVSSAREVEPSYGSRASSATSSFQ